MKAATDAVVELALLSLEPEFLRWDKGLNMSVVELVWNAHSLDSGPIDVRLLECTSPVCMSEASMSEARGAVPNGEVPNGEVPNGEVPNGEVPPASPEHGLLQDGLLQHGAGDGRRWFTAEEAPGGGTRDSALDSLVQKLSARRRMRWGDETFLVMGLDVHHEPEGRASYSPEDLVVGYSSPAGRGLPRALLGPGELVPGELVPGELGPGGLGPGGAALGDMVFTFDLTWDEGETFQACEIAVDCTGVDATHGDATHGDATHTN